MAVQDAAGAPTVLAADGTVLAGNADGELSRTTPGTEGGPGSTHLVNSDGSTGQVSADGSSIIRNADGSTDHTWPDGTKLHVNADGSVESSQGDHTQTWDASTGVHVDRTSAATTTHDATWAVTEGHLCRDFGSGEASTGGVPSSAASGGTGPLGVGGGATLGSGGNPPAPAGEPARPR